MWPPLFALGLMTLLVFVSTYPIQAAESVRIAVALPLSGPQQGIGGDVRAAVELAFAEHRARNGSGGAALELSWHDDHCSSEGGLAAARRITADPQALPFAVIGHACPSAALAAAPVYSAAGVTFLAAGSLPGRGPAARRFGLRHFRLPGDGTQSNVIGQALLDAGSDARIAFVRDRTQFSQSILQPITAVLAANGRAVLLVETFAGGEKDFIGLAQRIKNAEITHIAMAAFASEAGLLVAELRKANPAVTIIATDQLADPEFARHAGSGAEGVHIALAPDYAAYPRAAEVAKHFERKGGLPSRTALASYAAIEVLGAVADTGSRADPDTALTVFNTQAFETILGTIRFDAAGAADLPSHVFYTWSKGNLLPPLR